MSQYKILIVDDNHDLADCMALLLEQIGYSTTVVYTGEDAIARVLGEQFDLAILDINLPGMNGTEVLHAIKQLRPGIMGIMMTACQVDQLLKKAADHGVTGILHKPFRMEKLMAMLSDLLQGDQCLLAGNQ